MAAIVDKMLAPRRERKIKEQIRQQDRELRKSDRDLERELLQLTRQEGQIKNEIKKCAKQGNEQGARTLAKSLIQCRNQKTKLYSTKAQMRSVQMNIKTQGATQKMTGAMGNAGKIMGKMNERMKPEQVNKVMQQFAKENTMMEMKEEMISDGIDTALGGEDDDDEVEEAMDQVLDELGINLNERLGGVHTGNTKLRQQRESAALDAELAALGVPSNGAHQK